MAISRMNMERQMRNMGGIMGLEDQRQGYFLGKLVKKITKPIKKIVKSPLGKAALIGGLGAFGLGSLGGGSGFLGRFAPAAIKKGFLRVAGPDKLLGNLFFKDDKFDLGKAALTGLGATALAAPFLMGGDEEEVIDEGVDVSGIQPMVADIREQARQYYQDPTKSALYFMPPKSAVQRSFYAAGGGLADIPRGGYENGGGIMMASNMENDAILQNLYEKFLDSGMSPEDAEEAARKLFDKMSKQKDMPRTSAAEGGLMDLGGMEKDYREGGFVPIGAEERADDVPARLSKNEFVFTADAVRNAGGGDIDKGAEVMQNMMDNLEAGGMISEESQGKENPAQEMFDQAQLLESRLA